MKRTALFLIALGLMTVLAGGGDPVRLTLGWDTAQDVDVFLLYSSTDLSVATTNWPLFASIPGTSNQVQVLLSPGQRFFFLLASNFWGESSPPSNMLTLPHAPLANNLRIIGLPR